MPIVGILIAAVIFAAISSGMHSNTMANSPWLVRRPGRPPEVAAVVLHAISAQLMDALRPQTGVGHEDARRNHRRDDLALLRAPFELNGLAPSLFHDPAGIFDRLVDAQVETGKRHIDNHQGVADGAADHLGMINHFLQRDRQRGAVPLDHHRKAVADQKFPSIPVESTMQTGQGVIVGRQHRVIFRPDDFMAVNCGTVICGFSAFILAIVTVPMPCYSRRTFSRMRGAAGADIRHTACRHNRHNRQRRPINLGREAQESPRQDREKSGKFLLAVQQPAARIRENIRNRPLWQLSTNAMDKPSLYL